MTYIYVGNFTIIESKNGLSPGSRQAFIWSSVGILLIGSIGVKFCEILIETLNITIQNNALNVLSVKWW